MNLESPKVLPDLLRIQAEKGSKQRGFFELQQGQWVKYTNQDLYAQASALSEKLIEFGIQDGDSVGLIAESSPGWIAADMGILLTGAKTVPLFTNLCAEHLVHEIKDSQIKVFIIGDPDEIDVLLQAGLQPERVLLRQGQHQHSSVQPWPAAKNTEGQAEIKTQQSDEVATVIYTSGSTGIPKGVQLTHHNLISQVLSTNQRFPLDPESDRVLSCLPMAHIFERMVMYHYLWQGVDVYFADDVKRVGELMREIQPTLSTCVPRMLEKIEAKIKAKFASTPWPISSMAKSFLKPIEGTQDFNPPNWIQNKLFIQPIQKALGGNIRMLISGGAALPLSTALFFKRFNVPIYQGYGQTEASPVISSNYPDNNRIGSVGPLYPDIEIQFSEEQEILVRGPNVMKGYLNLANHTSETLKGNWLHTGDCGRLDEQGYLYITGRIKDLVKTSNGKYVSLQVLEQALTESSLIEMAMIIAEGRKYVSALIFPDLEEAKRLMDSPEATQTEIFNWLNSSKIQSLVDSHLQGINNKVDHWEEIQKTIWGDIQPTIENEMLTPTMKIRRHEIQKVYAEAIEKLYQEND